LVIMSNITTPLSVLCLKVVAKFPTKCLDEKRITRSYKLLPVQQHDAVMQNIIDYVTDAGRMDDDALPLVAFRATRTDLDLKNSKLTAGYFKKVIDRCCKTLKHIDVTGCFQVDDVLLKYMLEKCKMLKTLSVRNCRKLTDEALAYVVQYGPDINELHLGGNFNLTAHGVERFLDTNPNIGNFVGLHLSGLKLNSSILAKIGEKCAALTALSLSYSECPEDDIRKLIVTIGKQLDSLSVGWLFSLQTDVHCRSDFLDHIARHCPRLQELDISGLKNVQTIHIEELVSSKRTLADADRLQAGTARALKKLKAKFLATESFAEKMGKTFPGLMYEGP